MGDKKEHCLCQTIKYFNIIIKNNYNLIFPGVSTLPASIYEKFAAKELAKE